jgi:probable rRNA maturation factor
VSNQKIRAVNRKYLNKDRATDVISFEYDRRKYYNPGMRRFLGDVIVSTDKAFQNSNKYGTTFFEETALYIIHGILHLAGYDDVSRIERSVMRRKEDALLRKIRKEI